MWTLGARLPLPPACAPTMLAAFTLLAAQTLSIPLALPGEDDQPVDLTFTPDGNSLFVYHAAGPSLVRIDVATGAAIARADAFAGATDIEMSMDGSMLAVGSPPAGSVDLVDTATLATVSGTFVSQAVGVGELHFTPQDRYLLSVAPLSIAVVSLAPFQQVRVIALDAFEPSPNPGAGRIALGADGRTVAVLTGPIGARVLRWFDLDTGAAIAVEPVGDVSELLISGDRQTVTVASRRQAPAMTRVLSYDAMSGAFRSLTTIQSEVRLRQAVLDADGDGLIAFNGDQLYPVDLTLAQVDPFQPGYPLLAEVPALFVTASADRSRFLFGGTPEGVGIIADEAGGPPRRFATEAPFGIRSFAAPVGAAFVHLASPLGETLEIVQAGPAVPTALVVNTGNGLELDGPFTFHPQLGGGGGLIMARESMTIARVDSLAGTVRAPTVLSAAPLDASYDPAGGHVMIGLENGRVELRDPGTLAPLGEVDLGAPVVELRRIPNSQRAWARLDGPGNHALVALDLAGGTPVEVGRQPLAGAANGTSEVFAPSARTVVATASFGRSAALSPGLGMVEQFDSGTLQPTGSLTLPFPIPGEGSLVASPVALASGPRVYVGGGGGLVHAVDLTPSGPQLAWSIGTPFVVHPGSGAVAVSPDGATVFADLDFPLAPPILSTGLVALDAATGAPIDAALRFGTHGLRLVGDDLVFLREDSVELVRFNGVAFGPVETLFTQGFPFPAQDGVTFDAAGGQVLALGAFATGFSGPQPALQAIDLFEGRTQVHCAGGVPNATGRATELSLAGSPFAGGILEARVSNLAPGSMFGTLAIGSSSGPPQPVPQGLGALCVAGTVGRFAGPPQAADAGGQQRFLLPTAPLAFSAGIAQVLPGSSWTFQAWHRDVTSAGAPTSNTSQAISLSFR